MKNSNNRKSWFIVFAYFVVCLPVLFNAGCTEGQLMPTSRPQQPDGGDIVNPWLASHDRKFRELEKTFLVQISNAEKLDANSPQLKVLKSEYKKVKTLWRMRQEETNTGGFGGFADTFVNSAGITMKLIKPGSFIMGSNDGEDGEYPAHQVTITKPFYIGVYEVTSEQYGRIMGGGRTSVPEVILEAAIGFSPHTSGGGTSWPVIEITWDEANEFCNRLSQKENLKYSLPTEAQWEYACRAGTTTDYNFGSVWSVAASRQANAWGLYDMHGNMSEWCRDGYSEYFYQQKVSENPEYVNGYEGRVLRGGCYDYDAEECRSFSRDYTDADSEWDTTGFRIVLLAE